jgi:hypothetical protein
MDCRLRIGFWLSRLVKASPLTGTAGVLACPVAFESPVIAAAGEDARGPSKRVPFINANQLLFLCSYWAIATPASNSASRFANDVASE